MVALFLSWYHMSMAGDVGLIARIVFQVFSTNME